MTLLCLEELPDDEKTISLLRRVLSEYQYTFSSFNNEELPLRGMLKSGELIEDKSGIYKWHRRFCTMYMRYVDNRCRILTGVEIKLSANETLKTTRRELSKWLDANNYAEDCLVVVEQFNNAVQAVLSHLGITSLADIKTHMSSRANPELCLRLATELHKGQVDKAGMDYINHPIAVAEMFTDPFLQSVAYLHDTLEDTGADRNTLIAAGVSPEIIAIVRLLTRTDDMTYSDYLKILSRNQWACLVKIADMTHNMDTSRLGIITKRTYKRCMKYSSAMLWLANNVWRCNVQ